MSTILTKIKEETKSVTVKLSGIKDKSIGVVILEAGIHVGLFYGMLAVLEYVWRLLTFCC